jgi:dolichyl-phosphate beta-glucosyltransferase
VIPAYNEARRLPRTLAAWAEFLTEQHYTGEVVVADDGSRDETAAVVREYAERDPAIRLVALPVNQGKGGAVKAGMLAARGDYLFYVDADLNIAPEHVPRALRYLEHDVDVVAGQRGLAEYAGNERSVGRLAAGASVQGLRRAIVLPTIRDTQCGFKGFRRSIAQAIFGRTLIRSFAFDIEVLFLARQMRAVIVEMPVATEYRPESTYAVRKHLVPMLSDIVRIRLNHLRGRYDLRAPQQG